MKIKSIKVQIAAYLAESIILALICTAVTFIIIFLAMHIISMDFYNYVLTDYDKNINIMLVINLVGIVIFLLYEILLFSWRMNTITGHIGTIADCIHNIAGGDFEDKIKIRNENELGRLANDVNIMAGQIGALIENEKQWNDERYNMITNMSHDLKTPIMSINGYADLLKNKKYSSENEFSDYCDIISRKADELNISINQLFEMSKISSNEFSLELKLINARQFVEQIIIAYIPQLENHKMECRINIPDNVFIKTDPQLMARVFENIIGNSLKYASSGKYIDIIAEETNNVIALSVINYGPMIPENDLNNIFSRYYREKKNDKRDGSGLGLAIAKRIVELHNGIIKVSSSIQKTEFRIELVN